MENNTTQHYFRGGGEMGELTRNYDWGSSSLGPVEQWPLSLRNTVAMILSSKFPMFLWWGPDHIQFYNDAYRPSLGIEGKHPLALGQNGIECWPEIWDTIYPLMLQVLNGEEGVWFEDLYLPIYRNGKIEDVYWTFSYSAVIGDTGHIEGVLVICTETTEKVNNIKTLQDSRNELEFAIDAAELGVWDFDPATGTFTGNARLKEWFGLKPDEYIPLGHATSMIAAKDRQKVTDAIANALRYESGGNYDIEYSIIEPVLKKERIVKARGRAWFNDDKVAYRFNGTLQDITNKRKAQQEIVKANQLNDLILKSAGIGLFRIDLLTGSIEYNSAFALIVTGNPDKKEISRKGFINYVHPDDLKEREAALNEGLKTNEFYYSPRMIWDDGSVHRIHVMGTNTLDENGKPIAFSGTVRDITILEDQRLALEKSEELRHESEGRFRSIIEEAPVATALYTGKELIVEVANNMMLDIWGVDNSVIGKPLSLVVPELEEQPFLAILDEVYRTGKTYEVKAGAAKLRTGGILGTYYFDYTYKPLFNPDGKVYGIINMATNVTQQVLSAQRIKESQKQILDSFEEAPVGIAVIDREDLTFTMANRFYGQLVGRDSHTIIGKSLFEALPELEGQGFDMLLNQVINTGVAYIANEVSVNLSRKNGLETIYVNLTYQPRFNDDKTVSGVLVVATDVTEQVHSRIKVEMSEAKLRSIIATAPAGIGLFVGRELIVEMPNQTFINIVGKGWDIVGKPLREAMPELITHGQPFLKILDDVFTTGKMYQSYGDQVIIVQDGVTTYNYYNITYTPLFDENNEVYAILDIAIDVTEAITARQKTEETGQALRGAIELAGLATWKFNIKENTFSYSQRFMDWLGFSEDTKTIDEAYNPLPADYVEMVDDAIKTAIAPGSTGKYENEHPIINRLTGQIRIIHAQAQVTYDAAGNAEFLSGTAQDVTKERKLQQELEFLVKQRTEELEEANTDLADAINLLQQNNKELQQFAYIASHDLQEPTRKISIFAKMLKENLGQIDDKATTYLNKIHGSADRMSDLISDILAYSQLAKDQNLVTDVDLNNVINETISDFELIIEQSGAEINYSGLPVIEAIPRQMSQLFVNLISNSLKYSRADVAPVINITTTRISAEKTGMNTEVDMEYYKIEFSDNGIGFSQEYAGKIFNIFQRLHGKSEYSGTGIGLSICKKIVQNHHGSIEAKADKGQGATFIVTLPSKQIETD
ncbi:PAS domain S-box protein [Flavobacterium hauense]